MTGCGDVEEETTLFSASTSFVCSFSLISGGVGVEDGVVAGDGTGVRFDLPISSPSVLCSLSVFCPLMLVGDEDDFLFSLITLSFLF